MFGAANKPRGCDGRVLKVVAMRFAAPDLCLPNGMTFDAARSVMSDNFGNMVWMYGARHLLSREDTVVVEALHHSHFQRGFVDALLLSEANLLRDTKLYKSERGSMLRDTSLVEKLDVGTMLAGIGVQSLLSSAEQRPDIGQKPTAQIAASSIALHDEQHAFLDALEKRAPHGYSVRGNFTAAVANTHGRRKAVALGCPSFMLNPDPCLGASLARQYRALASTPADKATELRIAVLLPHPVAPKMLQLLVGICRKFPKAFVVLQTPQDYGSLRAARINHNMPIEHNQVRYFYDIQAWRRELRAVDFVFGSRIHGTLMGIYAGRPTLTIANDERILEMVEQMMLPHDTIYDMPVPQRPGDFDLVKHVADVTAKFDGEKFDRNRARIARSYVLMFDGLGVNVSAAVRGIAASESTKCSYGT